MKIQSLDGEVTSLPERHYEGTRRLHVVDDGIIEA